MYDKWMSKGALFKKDQPTRSKTAGSAALSFQQQYQNTNKETEDRYVLTIICMKQSCYFHIYSD